MPNHAVRADNRMMAPKVLANFCLIVKRISSIPYATQIFQIRLQGSRGPRVRHRGADACKRVPAKVV